MQVWGIYCTILFFRDVPCRCVRVPGISKAASASTFWVKQCNTLTQHHTAEHWDLQQHRCENLSLILLCQ